MTIGANDDKNWHVEPILAAKKTPAFMADQIKAGKSVSSVLARYTDLKWSKAEIKQIETAAKQDADKGAYKAIIKLFNAKTNSGWTTGDHTGEEVPVYAYGPGRESFTGLLNNTDQAKRSFTS